MGLYESSCVIDEIEHAAKAREKKIKNARR
jgi:hypothetical protein